MEACGLFQLALECGSGLTSPTFTVRLLASSCRGDSWLHVTDQIRLAGASGSSRRGVFSVTLYLLKYSVTLPTCLVSGLIWAVVCTVRWCLPESVRGEACACKNSREGGVQTSVVLASTVLLGCQKRRNCTLGQLTSPRFESAFFASFLCRFVFRPGT